jgi:hypothetical protein
METHTELIDRKVIEQLVKDIGADSTRNFLYFLKGEFALRIGNIESGYKKLSYSVLAVEAHSFKGCALTYGAKPLADVLHDLEVLASKGDKKAFATVDEVLRIAHLTNTAFQEYEIE